MPHPVPASRSINVFSRTTSTVTFDAPAGIAAGNLLVARFLASDVRNWPVSAGWTQLAAPVSSNGLQGYLWARVATGTAADALTIDRSSGAAGIAYSIERVTGWLGTTIAAGVAGAIQTAAFFGDPNPPAVTCPTGSGENLFLAAGGAAVTINTFPANYTLGQANTGDTGVAPILAVAARQLVAASDDPATFIANNSWGMGFTVAIAPAPPPLSFTGTVPAQSGTTGGPFVWTGPAVSSYFSGGTAPYSYSVFSGALPAGMTLNSSTGLPTGTPTHPGAIGTANIVIRATDALGATANTNSFPITITDGTPTISVQPSPVTVTQPATAAFSVTAAGPSLAYQWQRSTDAGASWGTVPAGTGATTASYTTPATTVSGGNANNGDRFRCVVSNAAGSVNSTGALLTVNAPADTTGPTMNGSITISALTSTSYTASWPAASDNVGVTGYERSLDGGSSWADIGNVLTVNISRRTPGSTDALRVRAYDAAGNRAATPLAQAVTLQSTSLVLGPFVTNGTLWPAGTTIHWSWYQGGRLGSLTGITPVEGSGSLAAGGTLAVANLPPAAGLMLVARRNTSAADDSVAYQPGTPA